MSSHHVCPAEVSDGIDSHMMQYRVYSFCFCQPFPPSRSFLSVWMGVRAYTRGECMRWTTVPCSQSGGGGELYASQQSGMRLATPPSMIDGGISPGERPLPARAEIAYRAAVGAVRVRSCVYCTDLIHPFQQLLYGYCAGIKGAVSRSEGVGAKPWWRDSARRQH